MRGGGGVKAGFGATAIFPLISLHPPHHYAFPKQGEIRLEAPEPPAAPEPPPPPLPRKKPPPTVAGVTAAAAGEHPPAAEEAGNAPPGAQALQGGSVGAVRPASAPAAGKAKAAKPKGEGGASGGGVPSGGGVVAGVAPAGAAPKAGPRKAATVGKATKPAPAGALLPAGDAAHGPKAEEAGPAAAAVGGAAKAVGGGDAKRARAVEGPVDASGEVVKKKVGGERSGGGPLCTLLTFFLNWISSIWPEGKDLLQILGCIILPLKA